MSQNKKTIYTNEDLKIMQNWSLERKIQVSLTRISEFGLKMENKIYILTSVPLILKFSTTSRTKQCSSPFTRISINCIISLTTTICTSYILWNKL